MSLPPVLASGLCAAPGRFLSAWEAYQFAAEHLANLRRLCALAESAALAPEVERYAAEIGAAELMLAAAEREWRAVEKAEVTAWRASLMLAAAERAWRATGPGG